MLILIKADNIQGTKIQYTDTARCDHAAITQTVKKKHL